MLRAFFVAGRPRHGRSRMGTFEAWDDVVRACCVWLGLPDPAVADDPTVGRGRIRADADEDLEAIIGVLRALRAAFGERSFTSASVLERLGSDSGLAAALAVVAGGRDGKPSVRGIGNAFKRVRDRIVGGLCLAADGAAAGGVLRWLVKSESLPSPGEAEEASCGE